MPFKVYEDLDPNDNPVHDVRSQSAVFTTLFKNPAKRKEPDPIKSVTTDHGGHADHPSVSVATPEPPAAPEAPSTTEAINFPRPTASPTKDPHYVYREALLASRNNPAGGISREYINRDNPAASEKPKIKNALDEGRYEFEPQRFRNRDPILLSGSSLFGSEEPTKSSRQDGGSDQPQPVSLENILIRSRNTTGDENPASLGQFSNPTTYEEYIKNLERFSGLPVIGNPANPSQGVSESGTTFNLRPPGPGRPSSHFSEGYTGPPFPLPYQLSPAQPPPAAPASPPDGSSSTSTSTSGNLNPFILNHWQQLVNGKYLI